MKVWVVQGPSGAVVGVFDSRRGAEAEAGPKVAAFDVQTEPCDDFEAFWQAYRYAKSKKTARKAWQRLTQSDRQKAMDAVGKYVAKTYTDGRYPSRAHAATWLNQARWEDEEPEVQHVKTYL